MTLGHFTSNIVPFRESFLLHSNPLLFSTHVVGDCSVPMIFVDDTRQDFDPVTKCGFGSGLNCGRSQTGKSCTSIVPRRG